MAYGNKKENLRVRIEPELKQAFFKAVEKPSEFLRLCIKKVIRKAGKKRRLMK